MLVSLMSIFDPSQYPVLFFNYTYLAFHLGVLFFLMPFSRFWVIHSGVILINNTLMSFFYKNTKMGYSHGLLSVFFFLIIFLNLMSLLPFSFSLTGHFFNNFFPMVNIWFGSLFFLFLKKVNLFFSHLTPKGSPLGLCLLLVPIELVSILIRPLALSLRLMANMVAGHMILLLLLKGVKLSSSFFVVPVWTISFFFALFEVFVCFIQAFVFVNLLYMYWQENTFKKSRV